MKNLIPLHLKVPGIAWEKDLLSRFVTSARAKGVTAFWFTAERKDDLDLVMEALASEGTGGLSRPGPAMQDAVLIMGEPQKDFGLAREALRLGAGGIAIRASRWNVFTGGSALAGSIANGFAPPPALYLYGWDPAGHEGFIENLSAAMRERAKTGRKTFAVSSPHRDPSLAAAVYRAIRERLGVPRVFFLPFPPESLDSPLALAPLLSAAGILRAAGVGDALLVDPAPGEAVRDGPGLPKPPAGERVIESMERAVSLAKSLLGSLGLSGVGYHLISCPTCGRCGVDIERMAAAVDAGLNDLERSLQSKGKSLEEAARGPGTAGIVVAVMGCNVNGPGEAKMADIGIAGGRGGTGTLFARGRAVKTIEEGRLVEELLNGVRAIVEERINQAGHASPSAEKSSPERRP